MCDDDSASRRQPDLFSASRNSVIVSILVHSFMLRIRLLNCLHLRLLLTSSSFLYTYLSIEPCFALIAGPLEPHSVLIVFTPFKLELLVLIHATFHTNSTSFFPFSPSLFIWFASYLIKLLFSIFLIQPSRTDSWEHPSLTHPYLTFIVISILYSFYFCRFFL
ncbi:PRKCQ [Acanthosepion pharaonis]|uniref:PRKCQ n=1 Tax=Acanthosepion pharaonis TaxID=158019 RepID=A0A812C6M1_ACAPH|nr:PRKCQ [Sepia pharaonis]